VVEAGLRTALSADHVQIDGPAPADLHLINC